MQQVRAVLSDGVVRPPTHLELIASDHCNIACRQCNHGSPSISKWNVDPQSAYEELSLLARVYRPRELRIIGGEPLLHPRLGELIRKARDSGISQYLKLVTNGVLLSRLSDDAWQSLDCVEISRYPEVGLDNARIAEARAKGKTFATKVIETRYENFRQTFSACRNEDDELVAKVFKACKIANVWGCHGVYKGHIYRCPQSMYVPALVQQGFSDGLPLSSDAGFRDRLLDFLNGTEPLNSCRYCVGTNGKKFPHSLATRETWRDDLKLTPESMLDHELLAQSLRESSSIDDCRVEIRPGSPIAGSLRRMLDGVFSGRKQR